MLLLGYDIGSSSVKVAVVDGANGEVLAQAKSPERELAITSRKAGWAEQDPELWWTHVKKATEKVLASTNIKGRDIRAIGIAYQMHGLVITDKRGKLLRPSIIWCDSRAAPLGGEAFEALGKAHCLETLLNSPGNFTASKLKWVRENEKEIYRGISHAMLPGDYIAYRFTGQVNTTIPGLSEGTFWNFKSDQLHRGLLDYYGIDPGILPEIVPTFGDQGVILPTVARALGLREDVKVTYRAGDQPNNAFSLNVNSPGEVAATAGTSGVVYGLTDKLSGDPLNRVNTFAHVNHSPSKKRLGVLLCVNGTGSAYGWLRNHLFPDLGYADLEKMAGRVAAGSEGLKFYPFGNGAERMLGNRLLGAGLRNLHFSRHSNEHLVRATLEGIAYAMVLGLEALRGVGVGTSTIYAGNDNLFQSAIFSQTIAALADTEIRVKDSTGAVGAALGAGIGSGFYKSIEEAFGNTRPGIAVIPEPGLKKQLLPGYGEWKSQLTTLT